MLPTQLKLRSSDTISLQSTWHSLSGRILLKDDPATTVQRSGAGPLRVHLYERVGHVQLPALL
jgi:hypothetical protein